MKNFNVFDLLQPISAEQPTGVDIREDPTLNSLYYQLKDLRQLARQAEKKYQLGESNDNGLMHWQTLIELAFDIFSKQSKDLHVLAWLIEALLRVEHYAGLAKGFELSAHMIDTFWDNLFPQVDEGELETKLAMFIGLNGQDAPGSLIFPIKAAPITQSDSSRNFAVWEYQQALELEKNSDSSKKIERKKELGFDLQDIKNAVKVTPAEFYLELMQDLSNCQENLKHLDQAFLKRCGDRSPPSSYIRQALSDVHEVLGFILEESSYSIKQSTLAPIVNASMIEHEPNLNFDHIADSIKSRAAALATLQSVANYFSEAEPHSPIPSLLERAVRWGNLSLAELLPELIVEESARKHLSQLTGINF